MHVRLDSFVVMPNHVHGIIVITDCDDCRGEAFDNQNMNVLRNSQMLRPYTKRGFRYGESYLVY